MSDHDVVRIVESSVPARTLERAGRWIRHAARTSLLVPAAARTSRTVASHIGVMLMVATITHVALMLTRRPAGWFWLILPSTVAMIAAILLYANTRGTRTAVE